MYQTWRATRRELRKGFSAVGWRADAHIPGVRALLLRGLTIFLFHEVTDSPSPMQERTGTYTPIDLFNDQIGWLTERFTVIRPTDLHQLGAERQLPENAAMVTFDDSWRGVFRNALPRLEQMQVPSVCFLNMATVMGDPDLAAVREYERGRAPDTRSFRAESIDAATGREIVALIQKRYAADSDFLAFQGPTATLDDLAHVAASCSLASFGSHLYHHWEIREIAADLYESSLRDNLEALATYSNSVPIFATPYGYSGRDQPFALSLPQRLGYRVVMIVTGRQNIDTETAVLDRLPLPITRSTERDWWHAAHRLRLLGWALRE
jgi:peptidoglycan/xylan/chitin deacetylase (PgdA/CDA1 family)